LEIDAERRCCRRTADDAARLTPGAPRDSAQLLARNADVLVTVLLLDFFRLRLRAASRVSRKSNDCSESDDQRTLGDYPD
jgi:hypothetical protein